MAAYVRGDWAWAAEEFLPLAKAGNVEARIYLGAIYGRDGSVPRHVASARKSKTSLNESIRWYRAAADQGSAAAQYWLGSIYASDLFGDNGRKLTDYAESVRWLRAAAEQGHPQAQMALGNAYRESRGVATNRAETNRWYQTSHKQKEGTGRLIEPQCVAVAGLPVFAAVYAACNRGDAAETSRQLLRLAKESMRPRIRSRKVISRSMRRAG